MKEKKIKSLEGYGEFREMCFPFLLEEEYPGWTGEEKWGIVTDLSEDALLEEYPKIMEALSPYLMLPSGSLIQSSESYPSSMTVPLLPYPY